MKTWKNPHLNPRTKGIAILCPYRHPVNVQTDEINTALEAIEAEKVPTIPSAGSITWEDWLKGRQARREAGNCVAPEIIRRQESSSDRRLRALYQGERGLPFTKTRDLSTKPTAKS